MIYKSTSPTMGLQNHRSVRTHGSCTRTVLANTFGLQYPTYNLTAMHSDCVSRQPTS